MMLSVVTNPQLQEDLLLMSIHIFFFFLRLDSYIKLGLEVTLFLSGGTSERCFKGDAQCMFAE